MKSDVLVVGLGEVGGPLLSILGDAYDAKGKDIDPLDLEKTDVMHIAFPFQVADFPALCAEYIEQYQPDLVIVNSTVEPGTTRRISELSGVPVAYSPVKGKHVRMREELLHYTKYIGGTDNAVAEKAKAHFDKAGFKTKVLASCETVELAKVLETTYFGLLIAWAQETERFCRKVNADFDDVMRFSEEVGYLPPVVFQPGFIGGHCVMPNIGILEKVMDSDFLKAIRASNEIKAKEWKQAGLSFDERLSPKQR